VGSREKLLEGVKLFPPMRRLCGPERPRGAQLEVPLIYTDLTIAGDYLFVRG
jgi:hypothetical protein